MASNRTYALFPSPVTQHEVLESMVVRPIIFLKGCIVKLILEVRIGQHVVDKHERVLKPDLVLGHIQSGTSWSGRVPSYLRVKDSHGVSPRHVTSIFSYMSLCDAKGGISPWTTSVAAHNLS